MNVSELRVLLDRHGAAERVTIDGAGLRIGYDGHVEVPRADGATPYRFKLAGSNDVT